MPSAPLPTTVNKVKDEPDWAQGWGNFDTGAETKQQVPNTQDKTQSLIAGLENLYIGPT